MSNSSLRRAVRVAAQAATAASFVAVLGVQVHAQPVSKDQPQPPAGAGMGGGGGGMQQMQRMIKDSLSLSADQSKKYDSISQAFMSKMQAGGDRQQINQERTAAIKTILTPDQAKKYDTMMEAMRARRRQQPGQ